MSIQSHSNVKVYITYDVTNEAISLDLFLEDKPFYISVLFNGRSVLIMVDYYIFSESLRAFTDVFQTVLKHCHYL